MHEIDADDAAEQEESRSELTFAIDTASTQISDEVDEYSRGTLEVNGTVSEETDYLVVGDDPSQPLLEVAREYDIPVVDEQDVRHLLQDLEAQE